MVIHLFDTEFNMSMSPARWKSVKIYVASGLLCVEICDRLTGDVINTYHVSDMVMVEHSED